MIKKTKNNKPIAEKKLKETQSQATKKGKQEKKGKYHKMNQSFIHANNII